MNRELWQRVDAVLDVALDADPALRGAVVADACGDDETLRRVVLDFLEACGEAAGRFESAPSELVREALLAAEGGERDGPGPGDVVGAYRLMEVVGTGGMGIVYRAERADGEFEKRVALKVIRRGSDTDDIVQRFHEERRILARLEHPNIAALLDGGVTASGLPYFVMEYASGEPIDVYVREARAGLEERLRLFLAVCEAVQHAHRNLIVHRDLKPSNIVVHGGEPKLLDFGIAKLLDPETGVSADATRLVDRRLTPHYAAPEQVLGHPVTTATDVYSLGVILYELIAGAVPYDVGGGSFAELERTVCRTEPEPPSARAAREAHAAPEAQADAPAWRIPPDLDAIVMVALRKEPERRYGSVAAFAEDVDRFLEGRPVHARPATRLYRASKFVRRNAPLVSAAAVAVLALVVGVIATTWQARIASQERDRREQEARTAAAARDFLLLTLGDLDPDRLAGQRTFTPDQLIERGVRNLKALSQEPEVRAPVMNTLAQVMFNLGERARADSLYAEAYALMEPFGAHPDRAVSLMGIGLARQLDLRFAEARDAYGLALEMRLRVLDRVDPAVAESMAALAFSLYNLGTSAPSGGDTLLAEAEALYTEVLSLPSLSEPTRARALEGLADIDLERGDAEGAEARYREALTASALAGGGTTPDDARRMWGLAAALEATGSADEAVEVSRRALGVLEHVYGESHPDVALAQYHLGTRLYDAGRKGEAAEAFVAAAAISSGEDGAHHLFTGDALVRSGIARLEVGEARRALEALDRSLPWYESAEEETGVGPEIVAARLGVANRHRGRALLALGELRAALPPLRSACAQRSEPGREPAQDDSACALLADVFERLRRPDSAQHYRALAERLGRR